MSESSGSGPVLTMESVDWNDARERMRRVLAAKLRPRFSDEDLDDFAQMTCIRLMRAVARGGIRSLEAIEVTIARRFADEQLRMKRPPVTPMPEGFDPPAPEDDDWTEAEDLQLYVREVLKSIKSSCRDLYDHWLKTFSLKEVARRLEIKHNTAIVRWKRCKKRFFEICDKDSGPLAARVRAARWRR